MKTLIYSYHAFDRPYAEQTSRKGHRLQFTELALSADTASLSKGYKAICLFSNDDASATVLHLLYRNGVRFIALRSAGYNHVDLECAHKLGIRVARVPAYSPYSVAEHAVALMLALNRKLIQANNRIHEQNFLLNGLIGFDMNGKTVGILGTGKIGSAVASILHGFGCRLLAFDIRKNETLRREYNLEYTDLETICKESDILTLHLPLNEQTQYLISGLAIGHMKQGIMLINTSRGGLVNTAEVIRAIKSGQIGYFGMDVYEKEGGLFFGDHSGEILQDDNLARLMTFPNVLITGHQAFLTETAVSNMWETTFHNLDCFAKGIVSENELA